jgi:hypothetical protein
VQLVMGGDGGGGDGGVVTGMMVLACPPAVEAGFYAGAYAHPLQPRDLRRIRIPVRVLRAARQQQVYKSIASLHRPVK